ncbi:peptidase dimerization domain-containing protein [Amycolatopsis jiangsuensis]|uniref:Metal-dependent amidase/aminoacylase/carboxypeptidase family protein n=1 Tax=Amycolatopsis jiangsuensis TaxID=1181879 RepID=A0A840IMQ5_9PSEU|nr:peptidase dimerization domain-containing protein [Amycolatopsis jiangsuensis]MBB4682849.1 metal-dependent amidase/aminoacylase/carboxypeptidase family protein [Amycolatopsis jiangsuensis]
MEADEDRHDRVDQEIGQLADRLWELARDRSVSSGEADLTAAGFTVRPGFPASCGEGRPAVVFLLPGDTRPDLGHNVAAAAVLGAALATARVTAGEPRAVLVADANSVPGDADAVLTFRPGVHTWSWTPLAARAELRVTVHARSGPAPGESSDALAGVVQTLTAVSALRSRPGTAVRAIVTRGGESTDVVPEVAEARFGLRAPAAADLDRLVADVTACAEGAALATGTKAVVGRIGPDHAPLRDNPVLTARFTSHLAACGMHAGPPEPGAVPEWSEVGDVSVRVPTLHPSVAILDPAHAVGTPEFAAAAVSARARSVLLATGAALARTAVDLLAHPALVSQAWDGFTARAREE